MFSNGLGTYRTTSCSGPTGVFSTSANRYWSPAFCPYRTSWLVTVNVGAPAIRPSLRSTR
jgi:hypothetical protein